MKALIAVLTLAVATTLHAAHDVPLKTNLPFEKAPKLRSTPITLVVSQEIAQYEFQKKMRFMRFTFPIGNSLAANTENALRAKFEKVKLARSLAEAETNVTLEPKTPEVMPKFPVTTFGTYMSAVKLTFVLRDKKAGTEREITVEGDGGNRKHAGLVLWESGWRNTEAQQFGRATDIAMIDALTKLNEEIDAALKR